MTRTKEIQRVSVVSIVANVLLAGFKALVGVLSGSIAIILDAVNNLTDALSSGITILGVTLAGKKPDSKHPFGYGRIEYISAVVISALVLFMGISSVVESAKQIAKPEPADYSWITIAVVASAVVGKIILGTYVKRKGQKLGSDSLVASGTEAMGDAGISVSTLVAIPVSAIWGLSIEGYIGVVIAAIIVKAGVELLLGSLSNILGKRTQGELAQDIKSEIKTVPGVLGVYDLVLHDYGPNTAMGTVHVEIEGGTPATEIHRITKQIQYLVYKRFQIMLTVGIYALDTVDENVVEMRKFVSSVAVAQSGVLQMHGFFWDGNHMSFDILVSFDCDVQAAKTAITSAITERVPGVEVIITIDKNYTE